MSPTKLHDCPVPICAAQAPQGVLMCRSCWHHVPARLKSAVGATWRAWKADLGNADKMRKYRTASQDAIDHAAMR